MPTIAIDGPGGAGKSTIAKILSSELGLEYIDTGAMYRAFALKTIKSGTDIADEKQLDAMLAATDIDFRKGEIFLDGENVSGLIRTPEISKAASKVSAIPAVRRKLVAIQRQMGHDKEVIMDGRDIGTNVLTDAPFKIFLSASAEVRAKRRYDELLAKGEEVSYEDVLSDMIERDRADMTRETDPLRKADDAIEIDTSDMTID
ncbi:MAG: (d)CMP kinase, partial [Firmicutes bacterium]|nr:(d)CMP kinase [Bacillota bacterium]